MAALLSAKVQAEAGDLKNARVPLAWAAEKASDPALRELARLRLATVMLDDKAYDEALAQLQAPTDAAWCALCRPQGRHPACPGQAGRGARGLQGG
jgi:predicted negative regulator of RcsB-dependent stress response